MEYWTEIISYLNIAGAIQAVGQAAVLWFVRRGARRANRIMAAFLSILAVAMCHGLASRLGLYERWPNFAFVMGTLPLLYGPLFYFYVRAMTDLKRRWRRSDALHLLPFFLGLGAYAGYSRLVDAIPLMPWHVVLLLATVQTVAYLSRIRRLLRQYEEAVRSSRSTLHTVTLGWLRWRIAAFGIIWAIGIAAMSVLAFVPAALSFVSQVVFLLVAINTFLAGYRAMLQPVFFDPEEARRNAPRYERSSLTEEEAERHEARLLALMERDKPFLDPNLSLPALARDLNVQPAHLSRIINERLGQNFFEFVNQYRVEAARQHLTRPQAAEHKLISVAMESGFNSLATFNRVFKDLTGRTPSDYRRDPGAPNSQKSAVGQ